jgi:hypothetical protein
VPDPVCEPAQPKCDHCKERECKPGHYWCEPCIEAGARMVDAMVEGGLG